MSKTKAQKQELVATYRKRLQDYTTIYVVKPHGVTPNETTALKKQLYTLDASLNVVKNSLFKIALKDQSLPELTYLNSDEHAVVFVNDKVSEAAKIIAKFAKDNETKLEIMGGILNGEVISAQQVKALSDLPSKEVLLGQLLSVMNGTMRGFVTVATGNIREFVYALNAIKDKKATA